LVEQTFILSLAHWLLSTYLASMYYIWTSISGILSTSPMFICFRSS